MRELSHHTRSVHLLLVHVEHAAKWRTGNGKTKDEGLDLLVDFMGSTTHASEDSVNLATQRRRAGISTVKRVLG